MIRMIKTYLMFTLFIVNCVWGEWGDWGICSVTCAGGTHSRNRSVSVEASVDGYKCTGDGEEIQSCNNKSCPGNYGSTISVTDEP